MLLSDFELVVCKIRGARSVKAIYVGIEFKSRTRLFAFHIVPVPLSKVCIQLFSLSSYEQIVGLTELFNFGMAAGGEGKLN